MIWNFKRLFPFSFPFISFRFFLFPLPLSPPLEIRIYDLVSFSIFVNALFSMYVKFTAFNVLTVHDDNEKTFI